MLKPTAQDDVQLRDSDAFEGSTGIATDPNSESRSSQSDAGLDDSALFDEELALDEDFDAGGPGREITMTDLEASLEHDGVSTIHSAELSDLNTPGDVDIEDLDESDLDDTDLPDDARLDPLEP